MDWDEYAKGNWKEVKGKIKEEWNDLTDDDLEEIQGRREKLIGKIQKRYAKSHDDAEREFDAWKQRHYARTAETTH